MGTEIAPLRILHIKYTLGVDGASMIHKHLIPYLQPDIVSDWLIESYSDNSVSRTFLEQGSHIYVLPTCSGSYHIRELRRMVKFFQFFRKEKPKVIYIDTDSHIRWKVLFSAFFAGVRRRVIHSHAVSPEGISGISQSRFRLFVERLLICLFSTDRLASSDDAGAYIYGKGKCWPFSYRILNVCIDLEPYKQGGHIVPVPNRKSLATDSDCIVLGMVMRLAKVKNPFFGLDVFASFLKRKNAILLVAGDGPLRNDFDDAVSRYHLQDKVRMLGFVDDVQNVYQTLDFLLLPSRTEGFGAVLYEASLSGVRSLVFDSIPKCPCIDDWVSRMPLDSTAESWADIIFAMSERPYERKSSYDILKQNGYDTSDVAHSLHDFLLNKG